MICIMCLQKKPESEEHVIPEAIGGGLPIYRLCKDCNDKFGQAADSGLIHQHQIAERRVKLKLEGKTGAIPDPYRKALKRPLAVGKEKDRKVLLKRKSSGELDAKTIPEVVFEVHPLPGGKHLVEVKKCYIDPRENASAIEKIIKDALRKGGLPGDQIQAGFEHFSKTLIEVEEHEEFQPLLEVNMGGHQLGVLKIAYEMGWYWLGDTWLDDLHAQVMRSALRGEAPPMKAREFEPAKFFLDGSIGAQTHLVFVFESHGQVMIVVRLFDIIAVGFILTDSANRYSMPELGVLTNDAVARNAEFHRLQDVTGKLTD